MPRLMGKHTLVCPKYWTLNLTSPMVYPKVLKSTLLDLSKPDEGGAHAGHGSDECKGLCSVLVDSQVEANVYPYTPGALFLAFQDFYLHTSMLACAYSAMHSQHPLAWLCRLLQAISAGNSTAFTCFLLSLPD